MKKKAFIALSVFAMILAMTACSFETDTVDGDGDMEGMWHLESIVKSTTAGDSTNDLSNSRIFWSFQHDLMQVKDYDSGDSYFGRFTISDGTLSLHDFYDNQRAHDDTITDVSKLIPLGITSLTPVYNYSISGSRLTLKNDSTTMKFKRF